MKSLLLLLLISNAIYSIGQESINPPKTSTLETDSIPSDEFLIIGERDSEAYFPGGNLELIRYINDEFDWDCVNPIDSIIEYSKVYLSFVVETDGNLSNVSIDRGVNQKFDTCCVNFIKKMPKWIPATNRRGKPVAQRVRLPITICYK